MRCYELNKEFDSLSATLEVLNDLESDNDILDLRESLRIQFEELEHNTEFKLENIIKLIRNMEADSFAFANEIERMNKRKNSLDNQVEYIKEFLVKPMLERREDNKMKAGVFSVSLRKSQSVSILDPFVLPGKYVTIEEIKKIDKMAIKKDLKEGLIVNGAVLTNNKSVQIK